MTLSDTCWNIMEVSFELHLNVLIKNHCEFKYNILKSFLIGSVSRIIFKVLWLHVKSSSPLFMSLWIPVYLLFMYQISSVKTIMLFSNKYGIFRNYIKYVLVFSNEALDECNTYQSFILACQVEKWKQSCKKGLIDHEIQ